jgi:hypothetical protein
MSHLYLNGRGEIYDNHKGKYIPCVEWVENDERVRIRKMVRIHLRKYPSKFPELTVQEWWENACECFGPQPKPTYKHACPKCLLFHTERGVDYYRCGRHNGYPEESVVLRFSNIHDDELKEGFRGLRAKFQNRFLETLRGVLSREMRKAWIILTQQDEKLRRSISTWRSEELRFHHGERPPPVVAVEVEEEVF